MNATSRNTNVSDLTKASIAWLPLAQEKDQYCKKAENTE